MPALSTLFRAHKIAVCAILLILGITASRYMPSAYHAAALAVLFIAGAGLRFPKLLFLAFLPAGIILPFLHSAKPDPALLKNIDRQVVVKGQLYENAQKRPSSAKIPLLVDAVEHSGVEEKADGKILVYSNGLDGLAYGDRVEARLKIKPVREFKNPGAGGYRERLASRGVFFTAYSDAGKIKTAGAGDSNPILRLVGGLRRDYAVFIRQKLEPASAEIVNALSTGDKSALPVELKTRFSKLGIGHLLAISGLHVGVAAVFFYMVVKWLMKRSGYLMVAFIVPKMAAFATIPAVFIYALLAGMSNSAVRAAIMAAVYLTAIVAGRKDDRLNSLAAAAIIILVAAPGALFEASFILSFSAVLGILLALNLYGGGREEAEENTGLKAGKALAAALFTTAAATAATLPFVINMFGFLPVLTFPANLAAMPVALAMVPLCIVSVAVFAVLGFVPGFLLEALSVFAAVLLALVEALSSIAPAVTVPSLSGWTFALFYLCAAAFLLVKLNRKMAYPAAALMLCLTASAAYDFRPPGGAQTEASFFDAGRKNIALFTFPDGKTVLIKGGFSKLARSDFIERAVVFPALRKKRVTKTDILILLSNDRGQLNGAAAIIEGGGVENLWINSAKLNDRLWKTVEKHGVKWKKIYRSSPVQEIGETGLAQIKFLHLHEKMGVENSGVPYPLLVKVVAGKTSFLLTESIHNTHKKGVEKLYGDEVESDVVFLPKINDKNRAALVALVKTARPEIVVCRSCAGDLSGTPAEIRETENEGMVSVFSDGERITGTEVFEPLMSAAGKSDGRLQNIK